jgi:hypothetical protein
MTRGKRLVVLVGQRKAVARSRRSRASRQVVDVLLTLCDADDALGANSLDHRGQIVGHQPDALDIPYPTTRAVRAALDEGW